MALKMGILKKQVAMSELINRDFIATQITPAVIDEKKIPSN